LGGLPEDYLVIDLETTGLNPASPAVLPTQVGSCLVLGRQIAEAHAALVDWGKSPHVDPEQFYADVEKTCTKMRERGAAGIAVAQVQEFGRPPQQVLDEYRAKLVACLEMGMPVVGHNIVAYDLPILERIFPLTFGDQGRMVFDLNRVIDSGMLCLAWFAGCVPPTVDWARDDYYSVIKQRQFKRKWNLGHCVETFGLARKHAADLQNAHDALADCRMVHYLIEEFRDRAFAPAVPA